MGPSTPLGTATAPAGPPLATINRKEMRFTLTARCLRRETAFAHAFASQNAQVETQYTLKNYRPPPDKHLCGARGVCVLNQAGSRLPVAV